MCVDVDEDEGIYTFNASLGLWPNDGFCRALIGPGSIEHGAYEVSADFYAPEDKFSSDEIHLGIFFNAKDEDNFDFISFR